MPEESPPLEPSDAYAAVDSLLQQNLDIRFIASGFSEIICQHLNWTFASIFVQEPLRTNIGSSAVFDPALTVFAAITRRWRFVEMLGLPGRVIATQRSAWVPEISQDSEFPRAPFARRAGLRSAAAVPIRTNEAVWGVLEVFSREPRTEDARILEIMQRLCDRLGEHIQRSDLGGTEQGSIAEPTASDAVIAVDALGVVRHWNDEATQVFGWTPAEAMGRRLSHIIIPFRYRNAHDEGLARFLTTGEARVIGSTIEIEGLRKDGTEVPIQLAISAARGPDTSFIAFIRDLSTERESV